MIQKKKKEKSQARNGTQGEAKVKKDKSSKSFHPANQYDITFFFHFILL